MMWGMSSSSDAIIGQPQGAIDDDARDSFLAGLRDGVAQAAAAGRNFVVDLAGVEHIGAAGLLALTIARKDAIAQGVKIALARPGPVIREILDISRYHLIFDIVDDPGALKA